GCGLVAEVEDGRAVRIRGNDDDVFSRGYLCPKGLATLALTDDPDRLRAPVKRTAAGRFEPISWDEAFDTVATRLKDVQRRHGRDAVAVYMGTPIVHKHGALLMRQAFLAALGTRNSTSAGSQDTATRFAASYHLYGSNFSWPVPDIDRTDYLLCIGANPVVSNGSILTAPNVRERLLGIVGRGGKVVVVDPRRTETARLGSEHVPIVPGTDAAWVLALVNVLFAERLVNARALRAGVRGLPELQRALGAWTPERVATYTGIDAATTRRIAREFVAAKTSAAYARLGVCNTAFGTLANWAVDVLNIAAGRLGEVGGAMFPSPAIDLPTLARLTGGDGFGRFRSRIRGLPEIAGDVPAATLAEEMETPGEGQVRAFVTLAGNPVLSVPNGRRLGRALENVDFYAAIDFYVNETTRHAHVILPPAGPLADDHVDLFFSNAMARNAIRWTEPPLPRAPDERNDWEILLELAFRMGGGPSGIPLLDAPFRLAWRLGRPYALDDLVDLAIRVGPHGDKFLPFGKGLRGESVRASPDGVDLGPLGPGIRKRVYHRDGLVDVTPAALSGALGELSADVDRVRPEDEFLLIGRRDVRTNNSWMHNLPKLAAGKDRCVLFVHPEDAMRLGLVDGDVATMESRVHRGIVPVAVTDEVRPGVVSLPHGYGHSGSRDHQRIAGRSPGVSANDWTDDGQVESVVGNSVLNGVRVTLSKVERAENFAAE
ncbi:MAG TPA: molybdopterin-dependent oxidoreductase, partial [Polyangiaceae bacterium]|nr:molybdopterin-dependent oxidoreductase [Polyangiaceae bacterium]